MQLVEADVLPRGNLHRGHDFGPHQRPGQGRERAGRVDERTDAELWITSRAVRRSWATAWPPAQELQARHAGQG